jgi:hypothetical protein
VVIEGCRINQSPLKFDEDDWDTFRRTIAGAAEMSRMVKEEQFDEQLEELDEQLAVVEVENFAEHVWALQEGINSHFQDGSHTDDLIHAIRHFEVDPMTSDFLVLRVAAANIRRDGRNYRRYFTFDHRRLWCMYHAGCQKIRVRIVLAGRSFDEFAGKADGLGRKITELDRRNTAWGRARNFF